MARAKGLRVSVSDATDDGCAAVACLFRLCVELACCFWTVAPFELTGGVIVRECAALALWRRKAAERGPTTSERWPEMGFT